MSTRTRIVHVGKEKGIELRFLAKEKIQLLIANWLEGKFPTIAKPTADDKRLAVALALLKAQFEDASGGAGEGEGEAEENY